MNSAARPGLFKHSSSIAHAADIIQFELNLNDEIIKTLFCTDPVKIISLLGFASVVDNAKQIK